MTSSYTRMGPITHTHSTRFWGGWWVKHLENVIDYGNEEDKSGGGDQVTLVIYLAYSLKKGGENHFLNVDFYSQR